MRIAAMDASHVRIPYRLIRSSSWNRREGANVLVVRLVAEDGSAGYGDCIFKQSWRAGLVLLEEMRPWVVGRSVHDIDPVVAGIAVAGWWAFKHDESFVGNPLLAAVEMAMWDLVGTQAGVPVRDLLGGAVNPSLDLAYQLPSGPPDLLERELAHALDKGFRHLSVKLAKSNRSLAEDVETVARIRRMAPDAVLSADVNGAWTLPTAIRALRKLERYDLAFVESPVIGLENMAALRRRVGVPLAVDEEGCSFKKLLDVVRLGAADVAVLDLPSLGGIRGLQKGIDLMECANIPVVIHGNGELLTPFAAFQLAAARASCRHFGHQFYFEHGGHFLRDHPTLAETRPVFEVPDAPGLGFTVDVDRLAAMSAPEGREGVDTTIAAGASPPRFPKY